jgi:hypothetical protein
MKPSEYIIDITPEPHFISSVRHQKIEPYIALAELIDNAIDAGASEVFISVGADEISVRDNGVGIVHSKISSILKFGKHEVSGACDSMGVYGVGAKDAMSGLGAFAEVRSVAAGELMTLRVDWDELARSSKWEAKARREKTNKPTGTEIIIKRLNRTYKLGPICKNLSYLFTPILFKGKKIIVVNKDSGEQRLLEPMLLPKMSQKIVRLVESPDGKWRFRVQAGLVQHNERRSFTIEYKYRILCTTDEPNEDFVPGPRFMAYVELLSGDWEVLKHKDGLIAGRKSTVWLYNQLNKACYDLLSQCHQAAADIRLDVLSSVLQDLFDERGGEICKPERSIVDEFSDPAARHCNSASAVALRGSGKNRKKSAGFSLLVERFGESNPVVSVSYTQKLTVVRLNLDHRYISANRDNNEILAVIAVFGLMVDQCFEEKDPSQQLFAFESETAFLRWQEVSAHIFNKVESFYPANQKVEEAKHE